MGRYSTTSKLRDKNGKRKFATTIVPIATGTGEDVYIETTSTDRLDKLAQIFYEDSTLWWIIAAANGLGKGSMIVPQNTRLRIPDKITILNDINSTNQER